MSRSNPTTVIAALLVASWFAIFLSHVSAKTINVPGDHKTIQAAINAAEPGDTVLVNAGTYSERLKLKPHVTVRSAGDLAAGEHGLLRAAETILDGADVAGHGSAVIMAEGSVLDGFTVRNFGHYDEAEWTKHHKTQGNLQSHEHIGESPGPGIQVPDVTCVVQNNIVHHIGDTGIGLFGSEGSAASPHIYQNICFRNMGGGIGAMRQSRGIIEGNTCYENFYAGIGHNHASPIVIHNTCYENIRAGIGISEGSCPTVRNNKCYKNRRAGIGVRTGSDTRPIIETNQCYENDMAGIGTEEEAASIIRKNECYRNKLAGIGIRHAQATIIGNSCSDNGAAGIGLDNAKAVVMDNVCLHNQTAGIGLAESEHGQVTLVRNKLIENKQVAIGIHGGWQAEVIENEIKRTGGMPPLVMIFAGSTVDLTGNTFQGGGVAAVRIAGEARIENNHLTATELRKVGPPSFGIWALPDATVQSYGNTFENWRHAISASQANVSAVNNKVKAFHQTAFMIQDPKGSTAVMNNQVTTGDANAKIVLVKGGETQRVVERGNEVVKEAE
ncbi:nitrous oxide reductase family maturation protein NosD [Bremerella sp.]|uniref:right-handed parallel beta-helix repeat-containing protein n=1 Tax=Bremerella sp. TaxID=2795602 RepID=UPI00391DED61